MGNIGFGELLIILLIIVILFGARRIPEVAKGLGQGIRHFKSGMRGDDPELDDRKSRDDDRKYRDEPERREEPRPTT